MKRLRNIKTRLIVPREFEFYHFRFDNLFRVESKETGVLVRAARANCSAQEKSVLIRELAVEGFIPDGCQWLSDSPLAGALAVTWVVDPSWVRLSHRATRMAERFTRPLLAITALVFLIVVPILVFKAGLDSALRHDHSIRFPVQDALQVIPREQPY